jgi:hypothetical protein
LNEIDNRAVPVIIINEFFRDSAGHFVYDAQSAAELKSALSASSHFSRISFMFDEWLWRASLVGQDSAEVLAVMADVKAEFPGVELIQIESFVNLYEQYMANYGQLDLFYDADMIGFDCYGPFDGCGGFGVPEIPQLTYLSIIYNQIQQNNSQAKIFLVPGAFTNPTAFTDEQVVIDQLHDYAWTYEQNKEYIGGMGIFTWGSLDDGTPSTGARELPAVKHAVETILDRIKNPDNYKMDVLP